MSVTVIVIVTVMVRVIKVLSPFSMERVLKRIRPRLCQRLIGPYAPGKALPGAYKARTKSAPNPLQNTLHGKRALGSG